MIHQLQVGFLGEKVVVFDCFKRTYPIDKRERYSTNLYAYRKTVSLGRIDYVTV